MVAQTREQDVLMFMEMADQPAVENPEDIPFTVLMPAFITSELKTFTIGFLIYILSSSSIWWWPAYSCPWA